MIGHVFKYGVKCLFRAKEILFWSFVFPFALSTFMYLSFGNIFETTEQFHVIPVAVVKEGENAVIENVLSSLSEEGENQLLTVERTGNEKAERLLEEETVTGILYVGEEIRLKVKQNGMEQTILQMMLKQIRQSEKVVKDVLANHPERLAKTIEVLQDEVSIVAGKQYSSGNQDNVVNYFYAVFAMTCLFASFASCDRSCKIQADVSEIGLRRTVTPTHKSTIIVTEFLVCECLQLILAGLLFVYLKFILHINVGDKYGCILLLLLLGTSFGTMFGIFIGSLPKIREEAKIGILVGVSLFFCACSDLMIQGIRDWMDHHIPVMNAVNPAAWICDSFYALNVYDTYERFAGNMLALAVMTGALGMVSYFIIRRGRYASL